MIFIVKILICNMSCWRLIPVFRFNWLNFYLINFWFLRLSIIIFLGFIFLVPLGFVFLKNKINLFFFVISYILAINCGERRSAGRSRNFENNPRWSVGFIFLLLAYRNNRGQHFIRLIHHLILLFLRNQFNFQSRAIIRFFFIAKFSKQFSLQLLFACFTLFSSFLKSVPLL